MFQQLSHLKIQNKEKCKYVENVKYIENVICLMVTDDLSTEIQNAS